MLLAEEGDEEGDVDVEAAAGDAEAAGAAGEAQEDTAAAAGADTEPLLPTERSGWEGRGAPPAQTFLHCYWRRCSARPACLRATGGRGAEGRVLPRRRCCGSL